MPSTRARLLYHRQPQNWPPRQTVDRDLELAVSMFAPGAETVKERTIHTAIGIGHYIRQGPLAIQDPNPLGPPVVVGLCGNCQHVETANPNNPACPVCGAPAGTGDRDYQVIDLRQPKGFVSYFTKARAMTALSTLCHALRGQRSAAHPLASGFTATSTLAPARADSTSSTTTPAVSSICRRSRGPAAPWSTLAQPTRRKKNTRHRLAAGPVHP